jgi:hypothetical protein
MALSADERLMLAIDVGLPLLATGYCLPMTMPGSDYAADCGYGGEHEHQHEHYGQHWLTLRSPCQQLKQAASYTKLQAASCKTATTN